MSFGFSVGDFVAFSTLIADVVSSLRSASRDEYKSLVDEFASLQAALKELQSIKYTDGQRAEVEALKTAALSCRSQVDEFAVKLAKFELMTRSSSSLSKSEKAKMYIRKLEWGFTMQDEVVKMKARVAAHVGYLNMRLMIITLSTTTVSSANLDQASRKFQDQLSVAQDSLDRLQDTAEAQATLLTEQKSYLQTITDSVPGVVSQMTSIREIVLGVWMTNMQLVSLLAKASSTPPSPDTRFTWAQAPVRLEDALGRALPVPSEYCWGKVRAIIAEQFASGPGASKITAGEYCVTAHDDPTSTVGDDVPLIPGSFLTMAIVIGIDSPYFYSICPRPGCMSREFRPKPGGIKECKSCSVNFHVGYFSLARPFRFPELEFDIDDGTGYLEGPRSLGYRRADPRSVEIAGAFRSTHKQRKHYKNVRLTLGAEVPRFSFRSTEIPTKRARTNEMSSASGTSSPSEGIGPQILSPEQSIAALRRDENMFQRLIDIVADELDLSKEEWDLVGRPLADFGVDSLISLVLSFRVEEELHLDLSDLFFPHTRQQSLSRLVYTEVI